MLSTLLGLKSRSCQELKRKSCSEPGVGTVSRQSTSTGCTPSQVPACLEQQCVWPQLLPTPPAHLTTCRKSRECALGYSYTHKGRGPSIPRHAHDCLFTQQHAFVAFPL